MALRAVQRPAVTQQTIATALGVSRAAVSLWLTGKTVPSLEHALMLRDLFGVDVDGWKIDKPDTDSLDTDESPA